MKIAQVSPFFFPLDGGVEKHVLTISKELTRRGHEVDVFTSTSSRGADSFAGSAQIGRVQVWRYKPILKMGEFGSLWPGFVPRIIGSRYDIVHSHSYRHPHTDISAIAGQSMGAHCILTGHSPFHPGGLRSLLARGLIPVYDGIVAPFTLKTYDRIVALTRHEAESMVRLGAPPASVIVIPNGVEDENFFAPQETDFLNRYRLVGRRFILFLGRINKTKGIDVLVRAFVPIAKLFPDVDLVIAGPITSSQEAQYLKTLLSLASGLGISSRIILTGRLSPQDKQVALNCCSVFALPSLYEPFGIVLLEAAAHSKPIVSAATDGPSSIITQGVDGILVGVGDPVALGKAVSTLLGDEDSMRRMGDKARETAEGYRWVRVVDRLEALYEQQMA